MQPVRRARDARCIKSENEADCTHAKRRLLFFHSRPFFRGAAGCENKLGANARVGVRTGGPARRESRCESGMQLTQPLISRELMRLSCDYGQSRDWCSAPLPASCYSCVTLSATGGPARPTPGYFHCQPGYTPVLPASLVASRTLDASHARPIVVTRSHSCNATEANIGRTPHAGLAGAWRFDWIPLSITTTSHRTFNRSPLSAAAAAVWAGKSNKPLFLSARWEIVSNAPPGLIGFASLTVLRVDWIWTTKRRF